MLEAHSNERGVALISVLFIVVILTIIAATILDSTSVDTIISINNERELKALYLADSGLQKAMEQLWGDSADTTAINQVSSYVGGGYSVQIKDALATYYKVIRSIGSCEGVSREIEAMVLVPRNGSVPVDPRLLLTVSSPGDIRLGKEVGGEPKVLSGNVFAGGSLDMGAKASVNGNFYMAGTFAGDPDSIKGDTYRLIDETYLDSIDVSSYRSGFPYDHYEHMTAFSDTVYNATDPLNFCSLFYMDSPGQTLSNVVINGTLIVGQAAGALNATNGLKIQPVGNLPAMVSEVPISIDFGSQPNFTISGSNYVSHIQGIIYSDSSIYIRSGFWNTVVTGVVMAMGDIQLEGKASIHHDNLSAFYNPPKGFKKGTSDSPHYRVTSVSWREIF